jgi:hypothetical protein
VRRALGGGSDYAAAARKLGIPPGQAYMIATGLPADGSDNAAGADNASGRERRPGYLASSQSLANPPHENPTAQPAVRAWIRERVAADGQMRAAMRAREQDEENGS